MNGTGIVVIAVLVLFLLIRPILSIGKLVLVAELLELLEVLGGGIVADQLAIAGHGLAVLDDDLFIDSLVSTLPTTKA